MNREEGSPGSYSFKKTEGSSTKYSAMTIPIHSNTNYRLRLADIVPIGVKPNYKTTPIGIKDSSTSYRRGI